MIYKHAMAVSILFYILGLLPFSDARAEFNLDFQSNPNVVNSIANWSCNTGGGMMRSGGGSGRFGPGCGSDYFLQEIVDDNGTLYYHVILGDPDLDNFALEFYMRTGDCCWWPNSDSGSIWGGRMGMGGGAPLSSSHGDLNDPLANAWLPLAGPDLTGNGTGNPTRVYIRQLNNDPEISQEFIKAFETNKPKILQTVKDKELVSIFELDMQNGDHASFTVPLKFINITSITQIGSFDAFANGQNTYRNAGYYTYSPGSSHGESYGDYTYDGMGYNVYNVDWVSYCDAEQNPDHSCIFTRGGGGWMRGGM